MLLFVVLVISKCLLVVAVKETPRPPSLIPDRHCPKDLLLVIPFLRLMLSLNIPRCRCTRIYCTAFQKSDAG